MPGFALRQRVVGLRIPVIPCYDSSVEIPALTRGAPPVTIEAKVLKFQGVVLIGDALWRTAPDFPWHN